MLTRFAAVALALALGGGPAAQDAPRNLIVNPTLEEPIATGGLPSGWHFYKGEGSAYQYAVVPGGHTGERAMMIEGKGKWGSISTTAVTVEPGRIYACRAWVKFEGGEGGRAVFKLDYFDPKTKHLGHTRLGSVDASLPGWQWVTVTSVTPNFPTARWITASLALEGEGKAWFDDLEMVAREGRQTPNSIDNGGGEDLVGGGPAGWFTDCPEGAKVTLESSTAEPKEGERCVVVKGAIESIRVITRHAKLEPGKSYTGGGFLRVKQGSATLHVALSRNGTPLGELVSAPVTEDTWQGRSLEVDRQKYPDATAAILYAVATGPDVELHLDGFTLAPK